jgi:maleate isomerase
MEHSSGHKAASSVVSEGIGIIVPFDFALDREYWRYIPEDEHLHLTRTPPVAGPISAELAEAVGDEDAVRAATASLVPVTRTVVYACTSGSFVRGREGERDLKRCMREAGAETVLTTSGALVDALGTLGAKRVAVATPYDEALTARLVSFLREFGYTVTSAVGLGLTEGVHLVPADRVIELAISADDPEADVVFLSCTGFATFHLAQVIERSLGKPFLTANQVTMWGALLAGGKGVPRLPQRLFSGR